MIIESLIAFYVLSVIGCGYYYYKLTINELNIGLGIINLGLLIFRIIVPLIPIVNFSIVLAASIKFLSETNVRFNIKDKDAK